jgi:hypothetical protein
MVGLFFDFCFARAYTVSMKTFATVEDYLEVMAGKRDITGSAATLLQPFLYGYTFAPVVSLARYDTEFLDSVTDATLGKQPLTDRQAELAVKLILKYQRQLAQKGVDVSPMTQPRYRLPLRHIDRTRRAGLQDQHIVLRFPYDSTLIQQLRDLLQMRQGSAVFDKQNKEWHIAVSEFNVNFVVTWATANQFIIDPALQDLMQQILDIEQVPYLIQLARNSTGALEITNAEQSLLDFLAHLNVQLSEQDLFRLVDLAPVLGYTIHDSLLNELENKVGADVMVFALNRTYELSGHVEQLRRVMRYAQQVNRLPLIVFDSGAKNNLSVYTELFGADQVLDLHNHDLHDLTSVTQSVVFCKRVPKGLNYIPLLVTHNGMLAGAEKQLMVQNSEKIIYFEKKLHP